MADAHVQQNHGYNLGRMFLEVQEKSFQHLEGKINDRVDELNRLNENNRSLEKLITRLTHAKKEKKADFTNDEEMKGVIDTVHGFAKDVFGYPDNLYVWKTEEDIDRTL